jgi:hypothetical protein
MNQGLTIVGLTASMMLAAWRGGGCAAPTASVTRGMHLEVFE